MKVYILQTKQRLPISLEKAWSFFKNPKNLNEITPSYMNFNILDGFENDEMYTGLIINYKVSPILGIPMRWTTEITHVEDKYYFVDEQRFGPYALWHHKHFFKAIDENTVEMIDIIHYALPLGFLGRIAHALFVKKQLQTIFDYRFKVLGNYFDNK